MSQIFKNLLENAGTNYIWGHPKHQEQLIVYLTIALWINKNPWEVDYGKLFITEEYQNK